MRPITAQPGFTGADLLALLATKRFIYVDCYTINNKDGISLYYTTAQRAVDIDASVEAGTPVSYTSRDTKVSGLSSETSVGITVDEQELHFGYTAGQKYQGIPYAQALLTGRFDGAIVRRDRYFAENWGSPWVGGVPMFVGFTSTLDKVGRSAATFKVKSVLVKFDTNMPRKVMQSGCLHVFGDPGCTIDRGLYQTAGNTLAGTTDSIMFWAGATAKMKNGIVQVVDLGGATEVRTIDSVDVGVALNLSYPLDFVPSVGAAFVAGEGCDHTYARCGEFSNQANYQGFPFVPVAETASGSV